MPCDWEEECRRAIRSGQARKLLLIDGEEGAGGSGLLWQDRDSFAGMCPYKHDQLELRNEWLAGFALGRNELCKWRPLASKL